MFRRYNISYIQMEKQVFPNTDWSKQNYFEGDILLPKNVPIGGIKASAVYDRKIWPNKTIPYVISQNYSMII